MDHANLCERLRQGDENSFRQAIAELAPQLFRYVRPQVRDDDLTQDILQQVFIRLWRTRKRLRLDSTLQSYCFRIATNLIRDGYRRSRRRQERERRAARMELSSTPEPFTEVFEAVKALPGELREVILLRFDQGLSVAESAGVLGLPEGTVKTRQRSALARLRESLLGAGVLISVDDLQMSLQPALGKGVTVPGSLIPDLETLIMASITTKVGGGLVMLATLLFLLLAGGSALGLSLFENDASQPPSVTKTLPTDPGPGREQDNSAPFDGARERGDHPTPGSSGVSEDGERGQASVILSGRVSDSVTGKPVPGALVKLGGGLPEIDCFANDDGTFSIKLSIGSVPEDASLVVEAAGYLAQEHSLRVLPHEIHVKLAPDEDTTVAVELQGGTGLPEQVLLTCEDKLDWYRAGYFDIERRALIELSAEEFEGADSASFIACIEWYGRQIRSEPVLVRPGTHNKATILIPEGGRIRVRVIGPDGAPMEGVVVGAGPDAEHGIAMTTGSSGGVVFEGVPPLTPTKVRPLYARFDGGRGVFAVDEKDISLAAAGDLVDVLFDLSGTGIVEPHLTIDGEQVSRATLQRRGSEGGGLDLWFTVWRGEIYWAAKRVYGLAPGAWEATLEGQSENQVYNVELHVLTPPSVTHWKVDIRARTLIVRVTGAASTAEMKLLVGDFYPDAVSPNERGEFIIPAPTGDDTICIRIEGGGYASSSVLVNSADEVVAVPVETAGTLNIIPNYELGAFKVERIEPAGLTFCTEEQSLLLVPGLYRISASFPFSAPWDPVEVWVVAREVKEVRVGPEFTCELEFTIRNRDNLRRLNLTLSCGDTAIEYERFSQSSGGRHTHVLLFTAEGEITLSITGDDIKPYQTTFRVTRNKPAQLDVELKNRD